jgi:hypothetical protein
MRQSLLILDLVVFFFGATIYVGTMWAVRLFFYPSWDKMTVEALAEHFTIPVQAATRFFTVVIPLMLVTSVVLIVEEWGKAQLWQVIVAFLSLNASALVIFSLFLRPINQAIETATDQATLTPLLKRWMFFNDLRWLTTTVTWLAMMWFVIGRGHLAQAFRH